MTVAHFRAYASGRNQWRREKNEK